MNDPRLAPARIHVEGVETLEERARALADPGAARGAEPQASVAALVRFRLGRLDCALDAGAVDRALARLPSAVAVATSFGGERALVFVDERPVLVADLSGTVAGTPRAAAQLAGSAVLLVTTPNGPVAVAVDGPLELSEERLTATVPQAAGASGDGPRLSGRLADGTSVISAEWLVGWASMGGG